MTDDQIKHMVNRFLAWRLPEHFQPDAGISFNAEYNVEYNAQRGAPPSRHEPTGTNLFDATQAEAMVRYMVEGMPPTLCETCHGTGQVWVCNSGRDDDGNAPVMERCPTCGYGDSAPAKEQP